MDEKRTATPKKSQIRALEIRRGELWSIAGGAASTASLYRELLAGTRSPSKVAMDRARVEGYDLMDRYLELMAERLTASVIAKIRARVITEQLRGLTRQSERNASA